MLVSVGARGWRGGVGRLARAFSSDSFLEQYAARDITPVTIQQMLVLDNESQRLKVAPHLQNELLIRLAKRYFDMKRLPKPLLEQKPVDQVIRRYSDFVQRLAAMPVPDTVGREAEFTNMLRDFYLEDGVTLPCVALGMRELRRQGHQLSQQEDALLTSRLDDLFTARLSVRMLIGQHGALEGRSKIRRGLNVAETARIAATTTRKMCIERFGVCPEIRIEGNLDFKFTYVESHLHHILFELLKNSVRAVVEQHHGEIGEKRRKRLKLSQSHDLCADGLPPVLVVIAGGKEDVVIKVSDEGGGIPRSDLQNIWSYQYTTAIMPHQDVKSEGLNDSSSEGFVTFRENFFGMGYGLGISRVFARYFGGDLRILPTEGWGTDAYIYLNRLESASVETLRE
mmetsp:Transcript_7754/g.12534  ORF Transcript_7754/g.12534 Transcript_7754/m.12534 type:complete len:397 (+) Transcript_7754:52-1242(+)